MMRNSSSIASTLAVPARKIACESARMILFIVSALPAASHISALSAPESRALVLFGIFFGIATQSELEPPIWGNWVTLLHLGNAAGNQLTAFPAGGLREFFGG